MYSTARASGALAQTKTQACSEAARASNELAGANVASLSGACVCAEGIPCVSAVRAWQSAPEKAVACSSAVLQMGNAFGKKKQQPGIVTTQNDRSSKGGSGSAATGKAFKVVWTGDSGVGKTSLILRLGENTFQEGVENVSLGRDFTILKAGATELQLWDTGGQVRSSAPFMEARLLSIAN